MLVKPVTFLILVSVCLHDRARHDQPGAGSRPARFYVIAWGAFLCGSVVFLLKNFGLVPHTFMTQHSWQVGALLEMILLSMTLSSRMNELQAPEPHRFADAARKSPAVRRNLPSEFARAREQDQPLSLLVARYRPVQALQRSARPRAGRRSRQGRGAALRKHARKPFIACRYGGDEFCAILPGTNEALAAVLAERLRAAVRHSLTGEQTVTVSIGYACQSGAMFESADQLFEAADAALYSAKQQGRNCIAEFDGRRSGRSACRPGKTPKRSSLPRVGSRFSVSAHRLLRYLLHCHRFDHSCDEVGRDDRTEAERARAQDHE